MKFSRRRFLHLTAGAVALPVIPHIALAQSYPKRVNRYFTMATFLYRCPNTGQHVQGWSAEEVQANETTYETVTCLACQQVHPSCSLP